MYYVNKVSEHALSLHLSHSLSSSVCVCACTNCPFFHRVLCNRTAKKCFVAHSLPTHTHTYTLKKLHTTKFCFICLYARKHIMNKKQQRYLRSLDTHKNTDTQLKYKNRGFIRLVHTRCMQPTYTLSSRIHNLQIYENQYFTL
jgi:hypothetical protein